MAHQQAHAGDERRPPRHIWVVGTFFALLHLAGAYDQVMLFSQDATYFQQRGFNQAQIAYFMDYPLSRALVWIVAVWGGLAASVLLLMCSRHALSTAIVAAGAQAALIVITFGFLNRWRIFGQDAAVFDGGVLFVTLGLVAYCWVMRRHSVLW